jgi:hypothetical protein
MLKTLTTCCLTAAAMLVLGTYLSGQGGERPGRVPSAPLVVAMQETGAAAQENPSHLPLANVGWIGVQFEENRGHGVKVTSVFPGGPVASAGVRAGDVLVRIGNVDIGSMQAAEAAIEHLVPRQPALLTVERRGKAVETKLVAESLADFRQDYINEMMRRDPRDPNYGQHHGISDADISAELVRRLFEQHERLERSLNDVLQEVRALRKQVAALQSKG